MKTININAKFKEYKLKNIKKQKSSVIIPTVKGNPILKYGTHGYYYLNFETQKGILITISHKDIIQPGLKNFFNSNYKRYKYFHNFLSLFQKYHYNFSFLEQIMLMTVPHTATYINKDNY